MELIDTDVLIDVQRGFGAAADWFATDPDVGVPGFVVMELVQDARNSDEVQKALALVDGLEVVWPSVAECQTALEQFSKLHLSNGLGLLDSLIAATAVGHGGGRGIGGEGLDAIMYLRIPPKARLNYPVPYGRSYERIRVLSRRPRRPSGQGAGVACG